MTTSDAELLRRYASDGAEEAFAEVVRRHLKLVYFAAWRRTGDPQLAEDVAQQVFAALARDAAGLARHAVLAGWLYTTTRFIAAKHVRSEHRRRAREQEAFLMQETPTSVGVVSSSASANWEEVRPVVDAALDELNDRDREAVLLRFFEGRPFAEIGGAMCVTEDAARMRVDRALDKLRALLERRGVASTAAALGLALSHQATAAVLPAGLAVSVTSGALAATGVAGALSTTTATVIGFMSTAKIAVSIGMVLGVAGVGSALYEKANARESEGALAALRREHVRTVARLTQLGAEKRAVEQSARADAQRVSALEAELVAAASRDAKAGNRGGGASLAVSSPGPSAAALAAVNPGMEMLAHPEYVRLSVEKYRAGLALQFGPLYRMLGLTPEQIAKFETNRVEFQQVTQDVWSAAVAKGVSVNDPAVTGLARDAMGSLEKDVQTILGPEGYKSFTQYNRAQASLEIVTALAGNLYRTPTPLSSQQGDQLTQAVLGATRSVPTAPGSKVVRFETDWAAVTSQTRNALTPQQVHVFETLLASKRLQQQMSALSSSIRANSNPKTGG